MLDPAATLTRAIEQANRMIVSTPTDRLDAPTPCTEYTVADLIRHLVVIANRVTVTSTAAPDGYSAPEENDLAGQWKAAYVEVLAAIPAADQDRLVDLPFGRMPLGAGFTAWIGEFVTHSWDLAAALGRRTELDESLAQTALELVTARIPETPRDRAPFNEVVPVPAHAPAYDRVAGWLGREPSEW